MPLSFVVNSNILYITGFKAFQLSHKASWKILPISTASVIEV